jgi:hypothetical protein
MLMVDQIQSFVRTEVHYHIHDNYSLGPNLSQVNLAHNKKNFNITLQSKSAFYKQSVPSGCLN